MASAAHPMDFTSFSVNLLFRSSVRSTWAWEWWCWGTTGPWHYILVEAVGETLTKGRDVPAGGGASSTLVGVRGVSRGRGARKKMAARKH